MRSHHSLSILSNLIFLSSCAFAQELDIPNSPLITASPVAPNVLFVVDNSGSMDWEIVAQPHYAACNFFNLNNYSSCSTTLYDTGDFYFSKSDANNRRFQTYQTYYLFELNNKYSNTPTIGHTELIDQDWRPFDPTFNTIHYNPDVDYVPWKGPCSQNITASQIQDCSDASFSLVRSHPKQGQSDYSTTLNLDNHVYQNKKYTHAYAISLDDRGYNGSKPTPTTITAVGNGFVEPWDSHVIFSFTSASSITADLYTTNISPVAMNKVSSTSLGSGPCYDILGPKNNVVSVIQGTKGITATDGVGCRTLSEARLNYANWFQYYRRRAFTAKAAISQIINIYPSFRYGLSLINDSTIRVPVPTLTATLSTHNTSLLHTYFSDVQEALGTPLGNALNNAGLYYQGKMGSKPILYPCQLCNTIMLTDGYYTGTQPKLGDVDGDGYGGGSGGSTLADIARYYYITDLDTSMADKVPTSANDTNAKQHMNTYTVGFGVKGDLIAGPDGWPTPALTYNSQWGGNPTSCSGCSEQIDDLWHAAFNSRGLYTSASDVSSLVNYLSSALGQIAVLNKASMSSASSAGPMIQTSSRIYQATFNSDNWNGELYAYTISNSGTIDSNNPAFKASALLDKVSDTNRVILTHNGAKGIPFRWTSTDTTNLKKNNPTTINLSKSQLTYLTQYKTSNASEQNILNYIRGDRTLEVSNGGTLRNRESVLGDIVHSSPLYIGPPQLQYTDSSYASFKNSKATRTPMIAMGANDGMLHIFSATTGQELLGYVPENLGLWSQLGNLSTANYAHAFYVDGLLTSNDVYFSTDSQWHTLLVGALGAGGQGIYALDITSGTFSESGSAPQSTVLFEFSDQDDADMGYQFGTPQIVKMNNNSWAIVIGNGYNATKNVYTSGKNDSKVSASKKANLFILFIEKGLDNVWTLNTDYIKIPVGSATSNGLGEIFPVDINGDYKVDYIYAGDLEGNIYKFNVTSATPSDWSLAQNVKVLYSTGNTAKPITASLVVGAHPDGISKGMMVYFGTGKYIETSDNSVSNQATQTFYGIWDKNTSSQATITGTTGLLQQSIITSNNNMRATTNNTINFTTQSGWFMDLMENGSNQGERVVGTPQLRNGRIIFTTLIPSGNSNNDPCNTNVGTSWLMELDARDGSRLDQPPFDINNDGQFNESDYIYYTDPTTQKQVSAPQSGIKSTVGVLGGAPTVIMSAEGTKEFKIMSGTQGISSQGESVSARAQGRQSWQEVN